MTPCTIAHQAPLSLGFPRQEYWNGMPFSFPGDLPDPGMKPKSPALQADSLLLSHKGSPKPLSGGILISSFLPSTVGQGSKQRHFNSPVEGQGSLRQTIRYNYNNKITQDGEHMYTMADSCQCKAKTTTI